MKTFYKKNFLLKLLKLPALIFFLLALSYNVKAQYASPQIVCYGSPINLFCGGLYGCDLAGSTYTWTDETGSWISHDKNPVIPSSSPVGYTGGSYYLSVQYLPSGLSSGVASVILLNPFTVPGTVTPVACNGGNTGAITITPTGGQPSYGPYAWSNGATTHDLTNLTAGNYTVTVTDGNLCTATNSFAVTQPAGMTVTKVGGSNVTCNGSATGSITISVAGGFGTKSYAWNNGGGNTTTITGLTAGTYTVTVTDQNLCTKSNTFAVTEPAGMTVLIGGTSPTCFGGNNGTISTTVTGGVSGYAYAWSNGGGNTPGRTGLTAGTYTVTVTDQNTCSKTASYQVTQPSDITITGTPSAVCQGGNTGQITTTVSGGSGGATTYLWNNAQTNGTAINLTAGTYTVTVTNGAGCKKSQTFAVLANPAITFCQVTVNPAKCFSSNDGSIVLSVCGGVTPFAYLWNNGQTNATASNLTGGNYTVTVTDGGPCTKIGSWQVSAPAGMTITGVPTNVLCNGSSTGKIDITVTGGAGGYLYQWNVLGFQGNGTAHVSALAAGNYTVTVTDANTCVAIQSWPITQPTALSGNGVVTNVTCYGGNNGTATISGLGGTAPYTYFWAIGSTSQLITGLTAGHYAVTITDFNSCPNWTWQDISEPTDITITGTPVKVVCQGGNTGQITTTVSGGSGGTTTYLWNNAQTNGTAINLTAGTYTVTVTNGAGCKKSQTFAVTENPAITFCQVTINAAKCFSSNDGSIVLSVCGGVTPYAYLWNNGQTLATASNLTRGNYTVTVTDGGPCTKIGSWQVTAPAGMTITGVPTNVLCNGSSTGKIDITVTGGAGGYAYQWNVLGFQGNGTAHVSALAAGNYTVTVTDANTCVAIQSWPITQPTALSGNGVVTNVTCHGGNNGTATISGLGGTAPYTYFWAIGSTSQLITGLTAGHYAVTITDFNSCPNWTWQDISEPTDITITGTPVKVVCNGGNTGQITTTVSGGSGGTTTYLWNNAQTNGTAINLTAGTYTVTVTNGAGCKKSQTFAVTENPAITFCQVTINAAKCFSSNDGSIVLSVCGGVTPYAYLWNNGQTLATASNLTRGNYTVTVTDGGPCTKIGSWQVTAPSAMTITGVPTNVLCNGSSTGKIDVTVTGGAGGYAYQWNVLGFQGNGTAHVSALAAGNYTVTVTDANTCVAIQSWPVTQPTALSGNGVVTNVTCHGGNNGTATISGLGGTAPYTYFWAIGSTSQLITGLTAGHYAVTITDFNSCPNWTWQDISEPTDITITGTPVMVVCNGGNTGQITTTVSGGSGGTTTYLWNNAQTNSTAVNLTAGTYTVTVTNLAGCKKSQTFAVTENPALTFCQATVIPAKCYNSNNGSIILSICGGVTPYSYLWNNGQTLSTAVNLTAGNYTVTVTDGGPCTKIGSWQVTAPTAMTITGIPTNVLCNGSSTGKIDVTVTGGAGGYAYQWNVLGFQGNGTAHVSALAAGSYTVTVTDANTCVAIQSWPITQPTALSGNGVVTNVTCHGGNNGTATISGFGGTAPYTYFWAIGSTNQLITGLTAGHYAVTITDFNSCPNWTWQDISEPTAISLTFTSNNISCYTYTDGAVTVSASGGTPGYFYVWNTGAHTPGITGLTAGTYFVTVTDSQSCPAYGQWGISEPPPWYVYINGPTSACCNTNDVLEYSASVDLSQIGSLPCCNTDAFNPCITYQWVVVGGTIVDGWNTPNIWVHWNCCTQGTVTVTATRCDGCMLTTTYNVAVHLPPSPVVTGPASVYANSSALYCALPAIAGHTYSWSVVGGSYTTAPGSNCITVTWGPYPPCGCGKVIVCETDPLTGCTGCDTLFITILPIAQNLDGYVKYLNPPYNTELNGVKIKLRDKVSGLVIATVWSGPNMNPPGYTGEPGYYAFTNVNPGTYTLESSFDGAWGGNNATDALLVQLYVANPIANPLSGLNLGVADVNASMSVTGLDALYIKLRTVGAISSYPAGDWDFTVPTVVIPVSGLTSQEIDGLCFGDVNGSYIPAGLKEASFLTVVDDGLQTIPVNQSFTYNIRSNAVADLGAMTLFMGYDQNKFEIESVNTSLEGMKYVIDNGKVAIAWSDTKPLSVKNNEPIISLTMNAKEPVSKATQIFSLITGSEFADTKANRFDNFDLKMSDVITPNGLKEFSMFNYPNPFKNTTNIVYTLPESGKVRLVITNMYGKTVRVLVDEMQAAGSYTVTVNPSDNMLTAGVYLYKIEVQGATDTYVKVNKMLFTR